MGIFHKLKKKAIDKNIQKCESESIERERLRMTNVIL